MAQLTFSRQARAPFRLDLTVWALRRRADNLVDRWDGRVYRRVLAFTDELRELAVTQEGPVDHPELRITVIGAALDPSTERLAFLALDRMLGLQTDLRGFYRMAADDVTLEPLAKRFLGIKPPRFPSLFEALVNGIACQQITLTLGIRLLNRLTKSYGLAFKTDDQVAYAFPRPEDLAGRNPEAFRKLGFSRQKARTIVDVAGAVVEKTVDLDGLDTLNNDEVVNRLCRFRGIGRWTAEYVLLRGLGRLPVFPGDDAGARGNLERWLELAEPLDYARVRRTIERWQPYAGLVYFHLLLRRLAELGEVA